MVSAFLASLALAAQPAEAAPAVAASAASQGPAAPATPASAKGPEKGCSSTPPPYDPTGGPHNITVCAKRGSAYRIDPDVLEAQRRKKNRDGIRPPERLRDNSCASVGPMGCPVQGVDLVSAAVTAATMVKKAVSGENVGKMFITDPQPNEYQLYLEAKARREAAEEEAAGKAVRDQVKAEKAAKAEAASNQVVSP